MATQCPAAPLTREIEGRRGGAELKTGDQSKGRSDGWKGGGIVLSDL